MTRITLPSVDDCPDRDTLHTRCPTGYLQWHHWAAQKGKTHRQVRCPTCGYWAIWVLRVPNRRGPARKIPS